MSESLGKLTIIMPDGSTRQYTLRRGANTIGRDAGVELLLDVDGVSRRHARIIALPQGAVITDLGSTNGTQVNGVALKPNDPQQLRPGDLIQVGPVTVRYERAEATAPPPVAEGTTAPAPRTVVPPEVAAGLPSRAPPPRLTWRRPRGTRREYGERSSYLQFLPPVYHDDDVMNRLLLIFESILGPIERRIEQLPAYYDPLTAPEALLSWLAAWVDLVLDENWPPERRRTLISQAAELYRWRGTAYGMREYIRIFAGVTPEIIEPSASGDGASLPPDTFRVVLRVPNPSRVDRARLVAIIEAEKPAHTRYQLEIVAESAR